MKVYFETVQLAGDSEEGVSGFRIAGQTMISQRDILRATEPNTFNALNKRKTISFSVSRTHASVADAEVFMLSHETDLPDTGVLRIVATGVDGRETTRWLGTPTNPAGLVVTDASYSGATTFHTYQFVGGTMRLTDPTKGA